ncbi:MAG: PorP/SprF family type IX secretion system membrane protein [Bacteroidia bacterium]
MMKRLYMLVICLYALTGAAQQTTRYNQYLLNSYLINPAYAGTHNNYEFMAGRHAQWIGFDYAPVSMFFSTTYTYRPNFNYKGWHGFGGYVENDKRGMFTTKSVYLSYSYHVRISKGYNMGMGLFVGGKSVGVSNSARNTADPALNLALKPIIFYPDIVPGFRLYSKKMFMGISVRNLYKYNLTQGSKKIGTDSKLIPTIYFNYGRKFHSATNEFTIVPSVNVQTSILSKPLVDVSLLVSYKNRIALGATYTVLNSATANLQVQILKNVVFGLAYNYATNGLRNAAANSAEAIIGITPTMGNEPVNNRNRVARCPDFDF